MKPWVEHYVQRCVSQIPDLVYGRRLSRELADHLELLAANLEEQGLSPHEASQQALAYMGDPGELSAVYLEHQTLLQREAVVIMQVFHQPAYFSWYQQVKITLINLEHIVNLF